MQKKWDGERDFSGFNRFQVRLSHVFSFAQENLGWIWVVVLLIGLMVTGSATNKWDGG